MACNSGPRKLYNYCIVYVYCTPVETTKLHPVVTYVTTKLVTSGIIKPYAAVTCVTDKFYAAVTYMTIKLNAAITCETTKLYVAVTYLTTKLYAAVTCVTKKLNSAVTYGCTVLYSPYHHTRPQPHPGPSQTVTLQ